MQQTGIGDGYMEITEQQPTSPYSDCSYVCGVQHSATQYLDIAA